MSQSVLVSTEAQLQHAQAKITYLGEQDKPIATVVFYTSEHEANMKDFAKLHSAGELYTNDELPYTRFFAVTPKEFLDVLQSLKTVLSDPAVSQGADFISFTILRTENSHAVGHEFKVDPSAGKSFYQAIITALRRDNELGKQLLREQLTNIFPE